MWKYNVLPPCRSAYVGMKVTKSKLRQIELPECVTTIVAIDTYKKIYMINCKMPEPTPIITCTIGKFNPSYYIGFCDRCIFYRNRME